MRKGFKKNKKGFTLIELIIVIAILAILAAVAVPSFIGLQDEAKKGRNVGSASAIVTSINAYNATHSLPADQIAACDAAAKAKLVALKLWPEGMTDEAAAMLLVDFVNGVAVTDTDGDPNN